MTKLLALSLIIALGQCNAFRPSIVVDERGCQSAPGVFYADGWHSYTEENGVRYICPE